MCLLVLPGHGAENEGVGARLGESTPVKMKYFSVVTTCGHALAVGIQTASQTDAGFPINRYRKSTTHHCALSTERDTRRSTDGVPNDCYEGSRS